MSAWVRPRDVRACRRMLLISFSFSAIPGQPVLLGGEGRYLTQRRMPDNNVRYSYTLPQLAFPRLSDPGLKPGWSAVDPCRGYN